MKNELIKQRLSSVYTEEKNVLFQCVDLRSLDENKIGVLESFHMQELYLLEENDDYFCGIRADHFCIEIGFSEYAYAEEEEEGNNLALITANHKGTRLMTLLKI